MELAGRGKARQPRDLWRLPDFRTVGGVEREQPPAAKLGADRLVGRAEDHDILFLRRANGGARRQSERGGIALKLRDKRRVAGLRVLPQCAAACRIARIDVATRVSDENASFVNDRRGAES